MPSTQYQTWASHSHRACIGTVWARTEPAKHGQASFMLSLKSLTASPQKPKCPFSEALAFPWSRMDEQGARWLGAREKDMAQPRPRRG